MDLSTRDVRRQQGERIKRASKEAGLSLDDLASRIGCSRALIYQYASGASLAQNDRLQIIAAVVGKPITPALLLSEILRVTQTPQVSAPFARAG